MHTPQYQQLQQALAQGWNTWNTRSVLSHVLLPQGFALNLCFKEYHTASYLKEALVGRIGQREETIRPGLRTYDGKYTDLTLTWKGITARIQSAVVDGDQFILVEPLELPPSPVLLIVEGGILWNHPGCVTREGGQLQGSFAGEIIPVFMTAPPAEDPHIPTQSAYLACHFQSPVGICTGTSRTVEEIDLAIHRARRERELYAQRYRDLSELYDAMQTCLAWDTIYDPEGSRVITPVSRLWNIAWGGYVLFDWDTCFAAAMAALDNLELACANVVEIIHSITENGFIPNFAATHNVKSRDRSQPPVASHTVWLIYQRLGERWLLEETYPNLLRWNRWWLAHREKQGFLCWGSDPFTPLWNANWETNQVATSQAAAWESGLDNSPMYDDVPFDPNHHVMDLADVGLMGLYVMDCIYLAKIAAVLGKTEDITELSARAERFRASLASLWDDETGIFLNLRLDTHSPSTRLSPTNFYPLLGNAASPAQAQRMITQHLLNPAEFWGEWVIPSISRSDPAFIDQEYWRGRVWGPMNYLVYLGLRQAGDQKACALLAERSRQLLLKEWRQNAHIHENYNAVTGEGCDITSSDAFYHWGGLLALVSFMQEGYI